MKKRFAVPAVAALIAAVVWAFVFLTMPAELEFSVNDSVSKPGGTLVIKVKSNENIASVNVVFRSKIYTAYPAGSGVYSCIIGIPYNIDSGIYDFKVKYIKNFLKLEDIAGVIFVQAHTGKPKSEKIKFKRSVKSLYAKPSVIDGSDQDMLEWVYAHETNSRLWSGKFALPVAKKVVTSDFGVVRSYNVGGKVNTYHKGVDFRAAVGKKITAANSGKVVLARSLVLSGNTVAIDHGQGVVSIYKHLSKIVAVEGMLAEKKQVIGLAGSTGLSTGPHLHWELRLHGTPVNPWEWTKNEF